MTDNRGTTEPLRRFPEGETPDPNKLVAGKYGTSEMCKIWGYNNTVEYGLRVQGQSALTLSRLHPDVIPPEIAEDIFSKANLEHCNPEEVRREEEKTGHDVIGLNNVLERAVKPEARPHINKARTSADTTVTARALQLKQSLEVIAASTENLRDILLEKSMTWIDCPFMDVTHLYDALPTVAGRPFSHYAEMLQTGLNFLRFVYQNSIIGKWADATGNHHSATALGIDGIKLQERYCKDMGIGFMDAPAQVPGLEFEADVFYTLARMGETINNAASFIAWGRSDDVNVFVNQSPQKKKGSSAMPHKDTKNGNPVSEEQFKSARNYAAGNLVTALMNCQMPYARDLSGSANARINFDGGFKFLDHGIRQMAGVVYWLGLQQERSGERVLRSYGVVTSQEVMNYLTDSRKVASPMSRSTAHDLMGELATRAWTSKRPFLDVLSECQEVTGRISPAVLKEITDPLTYIGQSKEIVRTVYEKYHGKKTL